MTEQFEQELGHSIRVARKAKRVSQTRLGEAIGVHRNTLHRWEKGGAITVKEFVSVCDALKVSPWSVLPRGTA